MVAYIAPEMLKHAPYDAAVDVYSLGATFFALLVGVASPPNSADMGALRRTLQRAQAGELSIEITVLTVSMLAPSPKQRPRAAALVHHPYFEGSCSKDHAHECTPECEPLRF